MPCSTNAAVTSPEPGPSSITGPSAVGSTWRAIVRASALLDGITAPVRSGFSIQDRMNCTSSSRRRAFLEMRAVVGEGILQELVQAAGLGIANTKTPQLEPAHAPVKASISITAARRQRIEKLLHPPEKPV